MTGHDTVLRWIDPATCITLDRSGTPLSVIPSIEAVVPMLASGYQIAAAAGNAERVNDLIAKIRIDHSEPDAATWLSGVVLILADELGALIDRSVIGPHIRQAMQQLADHHPQEATE